MCEDLAPMSVSPRQLGITVFLRFTLGKSHLLRGVEFAAGFFPLADAVHWVAHHRRNEQESAGHAEYDIVIVISLVHYESCKKRSFLYVK